MYQAFFLSKATAPDNPELSPKVRKITISYPQTLWGKKAKFITGIGLGSLVVFGFMSSQNLWSAPREGTELFYSASGQGGCEAKQKGYHAVTCPVWYDESDPVAVSNLDPISKTRGIDFRVRYIFDHQHPKDCSKANFYVKSFWDCSPINSIRHVLGRGLWGGLASDRVYIQHPDSTFSYCEGKSWECFFEPLTNCTASDIQPILDSKSSPEYTESKATDPDKSLLNDKAVRVFEDKVQSTYKAFSDVASQRFPGIVQLDDTEIFIGALLYALRLNPRTRAQIETILADSLPCDFDPERTISLPIRGSDKCVGDMHLGDNPGETDCLDFPTYMEGAELIRKQDPRVDTIILTSEDERYLKYDRSAYTKRWRFIVNKHDEMPSTGWITGMREWAEEKGEPMDSVFLSSYSSLQLQLRGKYFLINCASGFHKTVTELAVEGGCALASHPTVICLQKQMGKLRLCGHQTTDTQCWKEKFPDFSNDHATS